MQSLGHSRRKELWDKDKNVEEKWKKTPPWYFVGDTKCIALGDITRYLWQAMDEVDGNMNKSGGFAEELLLHKA